MEGPHPVPRYDIHARRKGVRSSVIATLLAGVTAVAIFALDWLSEPTAVDASLYVIPIVVSMWIEGTAATLWVGGIAVVLGLAVTVSESSFAIASLRSTVALGAELLAISGATAAVWLRKRGQSRVVTADRDWLALADEAPVLIRVGTSDGRVAYVNQAWAELLGESVDSLVGRSWDSLGTVIPGLRLPDGSNGRNTRASSETEFRVTPASGRSRWVFEQVALRPGETHEAGGLVGFGIDVTQRHEAERAVLENRARLADAEKVAGLGHAEIEVVTGAKTLWSDGMYRLLGLNPGSVEPSIDTFLSFVVSEDRGGLREAILSAIDSGRWDESVLRIRRSDDEKRTLRLNAQRLEAGNGRPTRLFATLQDVTERVEMERSLREHRNSLAKAQEVANLGSWVFEPATGRTMWSEQMTRIFGMDLSSLPRVVEEFVDRVVHPADREAFLAVWPRCVEERLPVGSEYRVLRSDGELRWIRAQCEYIQGENGAEDVVVGTCQDITEVRAAETALRESEERFDLAARGANDGIWDWPDVTKDGLWISARYFELLGYEDHGFRPCGEVFNKTLIHPDDVKRNLDAVTAHLENRSSYNIEIRLCTKHSGYRWFQMRGQATFAADGRPLRMAGSMQDIQDRKVAEERIEVYQEQLRSLAYAAVVAAERERRRIGVELHDRTIQNLGVMSMKLAELRERWAQEQGERVLEEMRALVKGTIRDTRALLAELGPPVLYELGFEAAVEWLGEQVSAASGEVRFVVSSDGQPKPLGEGSQVVLFQAVRELLANVGKHASAKSATVAIERRHHVLRIEVTDDGVGFDPETIRAPNVEHGGFGLFSIREGLRLLGGSIEIHSTPGRGTRVSLTAPLEHQGSQFVSAANPT